jgi:hypothetical protein
MVGFSKTLLLPSVLHVGVLQPQEINLLVWAVPRSIASTYGISLISFPPGTKMFQFPGFASFRIMEHNFHWVPPFGHLRIYANCDSP